MTLDEKDWLIALHRTEGIGWVTINRMLQLTATLEEVPQWSDAQFRSIGLKPKVISRFRQQFTQDWVLQVKEGREKEHFRTITFFDEGYPERLKEIAQPPWVLYCKGDNGFLVQPSIAVVGTRNPTSYGRMVAHKLSKELVQYGCAIVSGLARGIDTEAHMGALKGGGTTIAVLGSGIDEVYPKENIRLAEEIEQKGLVLSEYPPGTPSKPGMFPQRNRIISGLTLGTLVVEAAERSGALITANFALEQSREVFAIPGPITAVQSMGTNHLIKQGAKLVNSALDVLEEFPLIWSVQRQEASASPSSSVNLSREEQTLLEHLGYAAIHLDELKKVSQMELTELYPLLVQLQMKQVVRQLPGSFFIRAE